MDYLATKDLLTRHLSNKTLYFPKKYRTTFKTGENVVVQPIQISPSKGGCSRGDKLYILEAKQCQKTRRIESPLLLDETTEG